MRDARFDKKTKKKYKFGIKNVDSWLAINDAVQPRTCLDARKLSASPSSPTRRQ